MELLIFLTSNPGYAALVAGVLGLLVGSFLNVVIYRLPIILDKQWRRQCAELQGRQSGSDQEQRFNLVVPRSCCPHCGHAIGAAENIPLVSYLLQRGRCKHCDAAISWQYPLVELTTALLSVIVVMQLGPTLQAIAVLSFTWALVTLSVIDLHEQILPDVITLPFLWLGIVLALGSVVTDLHSSVIGAMAGYLSLWTIYQLFRLLTGKEGMGYGDFKLLAMLGAWMGWQYLPAIIIVSSLVGALTGIALIVIRGRDRNLPMPFGPFLAAAGWITMLWGEQLNQFYLRFAGLG